MLIRALLFLLLAFPASAAPPGWKYFVGGGATPCATIQALDAMYAAALGNDGNVVTASIAGNTMTVTAAFGAPLLTGQTATPINSNSGPLTNLGLSNGTTIVSGQSSGSAAATGVYQISPPQTVPSEQLSFGSTSVWFPIIVLQDGTCAVRVIPGDGYYDTAVTLPPSAKFPSGKTVTVAQIVASQGASVGTIQTRGALAQAGLLPDTMTLAQFQAVLTTSQLNTLNSAAFQNAHPVVAADWQEVQSAGFVDMTDPQFQDLVATALALSFITPAQFATLTTPVATVAGP